MNLKTRTKIERNMTVLELRDILNRIIYENGPDTNVIIDMNCGTADLGSVRTETNKVFLTPYYKY